MTAQRALFVQSAFDDSDYLGQGLAAWVRVMGDSGDDFVPAAERGADSAWLPRTAARPARRWLQSFLPLTAMVGLNLPFGIALLPAGLITCVTTFAILELIGVGLALQITTRELSGHRAGAGRFEASASPTREAECCHQGQELPSQ